MVGLEWCTSFYDGSLKEETVSTRAGSFPKCVVLIFKKFNAEQLSRRTESNPSMLIIYLRNSDSLSGEDFSFEIYPLFIMKTCPDIC